MGRQEPAEYSKIKKFLSDLNLSIILIAFFGFQHAYA